MDSGLLLLTLSMLVVGLAFVFSSSAHIAQTTTGNSFYFFTKQLLAVTVGLIGMFAFSKISFRLWQKSAHSLAFISIALLLLTMVIGTIANGSERWIPLPFGLNFQPSDFAKLAAVALLAQAASIKKHKTPSIVFNIALVAVMTAIILKQPNLSVAIILGITSISMLFMGGFPIYIFALTLPVLGYIVYSKIISTPYQMDRIQGWLNPWADAQDTGYNLIHSYYAVGSGGLFGTGFGHSIQKLHYLPFPYTDFIYSIICEELGFFGASLIIGMFALFAWRGFAIALKCPSSFGQMLAFGITSIITLQAAINISVTIGFMPVTGVTLPLISYGGTSVVMTLLMIGILLNISRYDIGSQVADKPLEA